MGELVQSQPISITRATVSRDMFEIMEKAYEFSQIMAKSDIIPVHYRGKPENVFVAIQTAYRMNLDPMLVMQNTFVVNGKLGMNSSFAIALANSSGLFDSGIKYRITGEGDSLEVTAYATLKSGNEEISYTIGMREAIAENWTKNAKYKSLPDLMLCYRAATLLIRTHIPEVINGMHMVEEIEDVAAAKGSIAPKVTAVSRLDKFLATEEATEEMTKEITEKPKADQQGSLFKELSALIESHNISQETVEKWCRAGGVESLEELDDAKIQRCIQHIESKEMANRHTSDI